MTKTGPKPKDMTGVRFGRLVGETYDRDGYWYFSCDCGCTKRAKGADVRRGKVNSCGCIHREVLKSGDCRRQHGMSGSPEYQSWNAMITRCRNKSHPSFTYYGMIGVKVCDRWFDSFEDFYSDMGPRPRATTLDRIDPTGNYEPSNCRWASGEVQATNKRNTVRIEAFGQSLTRQEWERETGIPDHTIAYRIKAGWPVEEALSKRVRRVSRW